MGALAMSAKERKRLEVFCRVRDGEVSVAKAAALLAVSERQAWRLKRRYVGEGDAGLVHRLRGRRSNRKTRDAVRSAVLRLYRQKYQGFGPTLACEYLAEEDGHDVSHDTLGRWLREEGLYGPSRRRGKHRSRRPRREHRGELVQMDGSWHDWFEGRGGAAWCCLMVLVDDATGRTFCRFYGKETLEAAFDAFGRYARRYGLPRALYVDKAGIYRGEDAGGEATVTQFGRAMRDLGVELILANSPQAKGRVERKNGTLQDRLVKQLRLRGVSDIDSANALLEDSPFLPELNKKFGLKPPGKADLHRRVTAKTKLDELLCVHEERAVGRDWCVQWRGRLLQVDPAHEALDLPRPGRRVAVIQKLDGAVLVRYGGRDLVWREVTRRPEKPRPPKKPVVNNKRWKPAADHPWKAARGACPAARASSATPPRPLPRGSRGDSPIAMKPLTVLLR
jgi:transposase